VKLEQASKVKLWMPTPLRLGEGRVGREETDKHLTQSTGVVSTACQEGDLGNWGRPISGEGSAFNAIKRVAARVGVGEGRSTGEAGQCRWREGPLLLVCF
jgi:hypothetical protein